MSRAHSLMDSKLQFLVSVPQLVYWLHSRFPPRCNLIRNKWSHVSPPSLLGPVEQKWGQEDGGHCSSHCNEQCHPLGACLVGVCLLGEAGYWLPWKAVCMHRPFLQTQSPACCWMRPFAGLRDVSLLHPSPLLHTIRLPCLL